MLSARGVRTAIADYWVSYRLTFLWGEAILVVPIHEQEDRYTPYRREYLSAGKRAYIYDPTRSRESFSAMTEEAFTSDHAWGKPIERLDVGTLKAIIFESARTSGAP